MPAYAVSKMKWVDAQGPERYLKIVQNILKPVGGKYLAFGPVTVVEGSGAPAELAIAEFPSLDAAKRVYGSEEYGLARKIRAVSAKTDWVVWIDGLTLER